MLDFTLLPAPRRVEILAENVVLPQDALIAISTAALLFEAQTAQQGFAATGLNWQIVVGKNYHNIGLNLTISTAVYRPEGYTLKVADGKIAIEGADAVGVFYGVCTLKQLLQQFGKQLPGIFIEDYPDFPNRGVMLDISRDRVPTMETVYRLVDKLASWKINQFQLYMEHTFAYQNHPEVWKEASPFTAQEILELDVYCRQRHIQLVPNQNCLGHMERWLKYARYSPLAECPEGFETSNGWREATTLNPVDPASLELVTGLYDELLPHFSSSLFNAGGDEPWEFGRGKSLSVVKEKGSGRVYLDYLLALHREITSRGRQMQFWTDIIVKYPDLVPELPRDMIAMVWGYEAYEPLEDYCRMVSDAGLPFYVCPGTSSWNSLSGRTENAMQNLKTAAANGHQYGAIGYLITDWGDNGHWQPFPVSYPGFAYGAALSWYTDGNESLDLPHALDLFAFEDKAGVMGKIAYDLGNLYLLTGPKNINGQALAYSLQTPQEKILPQIERFTTLHGASLTPDTLRRYIQTIDELIGNLSQADVQELIRAEYQQAACLLRHAAKRLLWILGEPVAQPDELLAELEQLVTQQRILWLARSRPGGLEDSLRRFDPLFNEYRLSLAGV